MLNRLFAPLVLFGLLAATSTVLVLALALSQPWLGLRFQADNTGVIVARVDKDGPAAALKPGDRILSLAPADAPGEAVPFLPLDLIEEPDGLATITDMQALFAKQGRMNAILRAGPAEFSVATAEGEVTHRLLAKQGRPVTDLPFIFWMQIAVGIVGVLLGGWVLSIRRRQAAAAYLALSGVGLMVSAHAAALYTSRALPLTEDLFGWASGFNSLGALVFGIGMVNLFLVYPVRHLPRWVPALVGLAFGTWAILSFLRLTGTAAMAIHIPTVTLMGFILVAVVGQVHATRGNPHARAALRWFGLSVAIGAGSFVSLIALPQALGYQPKISQSYAFALFLVIYAGLVLGVVRYRLFDLEFWAFRVLFYAGGVAFLLLMDAVLVYAVSLERLPAFSISLLVVAFLYLPARDVVMRKLGGQEITSTAELFDMLSGVALAPDDTTQRQRFEELLDRLFQPLRITEAPAPVPEPALGTGGGTLDVPGIDGVSDLRMYWPHHGRRMFSAQDVQRVGGILRLGAQIVERRRAYEAGASQERQRINRDMHDNVGVQLLGALHSRDTGRKDVLIRQALTDLRDMISNTGTGPLDLCTLLADMRAEMAEYLATADIALDWQDRDVPETRIGPAAVHAIRSSLREGVGNILRHSGASSACIALALSDPDWLDLTITDDGGGLGATLGTAQAKGNGLRNLRSRSEAWGGRFSVTPGADGRGTTLRISIPLSQRTTSIAPMREAGE